MQLVGEEDVGSYRAPREQEAQRGGGSAGGEAGKQRRPETGNDADAGRSEPDTERFGVGSAHPGRGERVAAVSNGAPTANRQSSLEGGPAGRLWEGTSRGAADSDAAAGSTDARPGFQHHSVRQHKGGRQREAAAQGQLSPGRQVGEIMRRKVEQEGWQLVVEGHRCVRLCVQSCCMT